MWAAWSFIQTWLLSNIFLIFCILRETPLIMPLTTLTSHSVISSLSHQCSKFSFLKSKFAISIYCSSSPNLSHTLQFGSCLWQNTFCTSSDTFWGVSAIFLVTFQYQYSILTLLCHRRPFSSSGTILLC